LLHYIIPVFNGRQALGRNVGALDDFLGARYGKPYEIVLSDDGSSDGSAGAAAEIAAVRPRVRAVGYAVNRGRGGAIKFAAESCPDGLIIYSDLDFPLTSSLDPILPLAERLAEAPVVIGSRFHPGSRTARLWRRNLIGKAHRQTVRRFFPWLKVSDPDMGFKGFRQPEFGRLNRLSRMDRWSWDLEVLVIARRNGLRIEEMPIDWLEDFEGYSTSVHLLRDSREELRGILAIRKNLREGLYDF
jgi:glycosyltransferase involved in cell wall biosynthesis